MAKADLTIARMYAELVEDVQLRDRLAGVGQEFERTRRAILSLTGEQQILEDNAVISRSIRLRNPYVDPMSLIQVDLLRRKRAGNGSEELNYALGATIDVSPQGCTIQDEENLSGHSERKRRASVFLKFRTDTVLAWWLFGNGFRKRKSIRRWFRHES